MIINDIYFLKIITCSEILKVEPLALFPTWLLRSLDDSKQEFSQLHSFSQLLEFFFFRLGVCADWKKAYSLGRRQVDYLISKKDIFIEIRNIYNRFSLQRRRREVTHYKIRKQKCFIINILTITPESSVSDPDSVGSVSFGRIYLRKR